MSERSNLGSNFVLLLLFDLELSKVACGLGASKGIFFDGAENCIIGYRGNAIQRNLNCFLKFDFV